MIECLNCGSETGKPCDIYCMGFKGVHQCKSCKQCITQGCQDCMHEPSEVRE